MIMIDGIRGPADATRLDFGHQGKNSSQIAGDSGDKIRVIRVTRIFDG